jgi:hypothetical protein
MEFLPSARNRHTRSLVAVGCEFTFPIDFSSGKHWELTSSPSTVVSYSKELATCLAACRQVAELLVREQRSYHRELINARRPDPRIYSIGDIVFARHAVKSDAVRDNVDKLQYAFTGPWRVTASLPGASYELEHCDKTLKKEKKHTSDLSPYPTELIPFQPVNGADTRYRQIYKPISAHPFKEAGIKGFTPIQPFKVATDVLAQKISALRFIGPAYLSSTTKLHPSHGSTTWNMNAICQGILLPNCQF